MKYALLIYSTTTDDEWNALSEAEQGAIYAEYTAVRESPGVVGGHQLQSKDSATTVRVRDGKTLTTDGPYAETKEFLGGFVIIDVPDLDAALEWAARHPAAARSAVEVRPLVAYS